MSRASHIECMCAPRSGSDGPNTACTPKCTNWHAGDKESDCDCDCDCDASREHRLARWVFLCLVHDAFIIASNDRMIQRIWKKLTN
jgi:hypothetical protein